MNAIDLKNSLVCAVGAAIMATSVSLFFHAKRSDAADSTRPEAHIYQQFKAHNCELCNTTEDLEWCHAYPYNMAVGTELAYLITEKTNGVTLCRPCHTCVSHFQNTRKYWNTRLIPIVRELQAAKKEYDK
jgi:hypothetical protein